MLAAGDTWHRRRSDDEQINRMTLDTITAVIPVYNKEAYVARAIQSVLDQVRPVDEIIIVDDGSTDRSRDKIGLFQDTRIRVLRSTAPASGPSHARNQAIRAATSTWVAFLDADDMWHPGFIAEVEAILDQATDQMGCVFTGWHDVWADGSITVDKYSAEFHQHPPLQVDFDSFLAKWVTLRSCPMWTSAVVVRRDVLLDTGLFPERCRRGEDKDTWLRVMSVTRAIRSCRPCSSYYRSTSAQITRTCSLNVRHCLCPTLERMISETSGRRRRLLMRLFNTEVFDYAIQVGQREHISPEMYRGFHIWLDPGRYCILLALTYVPVQIQMIVRSFVLRLRVGLGRPPSKSHASAVEFAGVRTPNSLFKDQSTTLLDQ
jgi:glycosyltransferase involved in cell wall biosynthesis